MKTSSDIDKLMIVMMNIVDMLSHNWCFSLHRVLPPPEGTNKAKEEQASAFAASAAGGTAVKPSTSQPPKKVVREGAVKHPEGSKVCSRAAYVVEIHVLDAKHQDSPESTNVNNVFDWLFTRQKDITYQGITKRSPLGTQCKSNVYKGLHQQSV